MKRIATAALAVLTVTSLGFAAGCGNKQQLDDLTKKNADLNTEIQSLTGQVAQLNQDEANLQKELDSCKATPTPTAKGKTTTKKKTK